MTLVDCFVTYGITSRARGKGTQPVCNSILLVIHAAKEMQQRRRFSVYVMEMLG